jgi:hypothetical protein
LVAAVANKLARIAWAVLAQERSYEARVKRLRRQRALSQLDSGGRNEAG